MRSRIDTDRYEVTITETLQKSVTLEAESREEAEGLVNDDWYTGEYILDAENFVGVEFTASKIGADT